MVLSLLDVQIGVENGSSPFNTSSFTGLLQLSSSNEQPPNIIPNAPYMYMDPKTCAAIARHLPVVLSSYTNLYIWNTTDPQFEKIVTSPSYLDSHLNFWRRQFDHQSTIQLLNLTLDTAIVSPPQQYFPCQPFHASDGSNHYILGKVFLQAAFLGITGNKASTSSLRLLDLEQRSQIFCPLSQLMPISHQTQLLILRRVGSIIGRLLRHRLAVMLALLLAEQPLMAQLPCRRRHLGFQVVRKLASLSELLWAFCYLPLRQCSAYVDGKVKRCLQGKI